MKNSDMPAMPTSPNDSDPEWAAARTGGLTKREMFAMHAMQGLLSNSGGVIQSNSFSGFGWCNSNEKEMAVLSLSCADALLEELAK